MRKWLFLKTFILSYLRTIKGFKEETRGKGAKGRPKKKFDPTDTQSLLKRLAYLEAENDFLKKLHALADAAEKKNSR